MSIEIARLRPVPPLILPSATTWSYKICDQSDVCRPPWYPTSDPFTGKPTAWRHFKDAYPIFTKENRNGKVSKPGKGSLARNATTRIRFCSCRFNNHSPGDHVGMSEDGDALKSFDAAIGGMHMNPELHESIGSLPWKSPREGSPLHTNHDHVTQGSEESQNVFWRSCSPCLKGIQGEELTYGNIKQSFMEKKRSGTSMPMSLRTLKHKQAQKRGEKSHNVDEINGPFIACSFQKAFDSMVFMIRTLQGYTIHLRQVLLYEDLHELLVMVQKEMNSTFLWLFQQVFACTPKLMVAVMILLANFTVYSMGNNVSMAALPMPGQELSTVFVSDNIGDMKMNSQLSYKESLPKCTPDLGRVLGIHAGNGSGGSGGRIVSSVGGPTDDGEQSGRYSKSKTMYSDRHLPDEIAGGMLLKSLLRDGFADTSFMFDQFSALDDEIKQNLVAPVHVQVEPDNYLCYDRTELAYQYAISTNATNPLLLANYAQFLSLVRHDHDRAEELFSRAIRADPTDGDAMGRFASFLWLARGDWCRAQRAYEAAMESDPSNPFHAGSYANFLWHTEDDETPYPLN